MKFRQREIMFREGIISFLGIGEKKETIEDKYCNACRVAKKDDCKNCSKEIKEITDGR